MAISSEKIGRLGGGSGPETALVYANAGEIVRLPPGWQGAIALAPYRLGYIDGPNTFEMYESGPVFLVRTR